MKSPLSFSRSFHGLILTRIIKIRDCTLLCVHICVHFLRQFRMRMKLLSNLTATLLLHH